MAFNCVGNAVPSIRNSTSPPSAHATPCGVAVKPSGRRHRAVTARVAFSARGAAIVSRQPQRTA
jgi:hypothetical protein